MPINFLTQLIRRKQSQDTVQGNISELKNFKNLIHKGEFDDVLQKIEKLEKIGLENANLKPEILILRSLIFSHLGNHNDGLKLAEQALDESTRVRRQFFVFHAIISKAIAFLELGKLIKCLEAIEEAEKLQFTISKDSKTDFIERDATLNYLKSKISRRKGNLDRAMDYLQQSLDTQKVLGNQNEIANIYNDIGIIYATKGKMDSALTNLLQSLSIFEELGITQSIVKLLNNIGMIYGEKREHNKALDYYQKCLILSKKIENKRYSAALSLNIGLIHRQRGDLNSALDFFEKGMDIFEELDRKSEIATCLSNIGIIYNIKGELELALQFFQKGLVIAEEIEDKRELSASYQNIANVFEIKGESETAITYYKKSLDISKEIGNNFEIADLLYNLISVSVFSGSIGQANSYLQQLNKINNQEKDDFISQKYRLSRAIVLKTSDRIIKKAEAQQLLQEIAQEEILDIQITISALLNLCELLIIELKTAGSEEVLGEVKILLERLFEMAKEQHSYLWLAQIYMLKAKVALLDLDVKQAQFSLEQAKLIADEKGLNQLNITITLEHDLLFNQMNKWNKIIEQKPSMNEILELTQFEQLLERMVYKKLYCKEEEIREYAEKARMLVESWEKHSVIPS